MNSTLPLVTKSACEFASLYKSLLSEMLMFIIVIWSITGFTVICITVLACYSPDFNSGK